MFGKSSFGAAHSLNLAILGLSCSDLSLVPPQEILPVLAAYRQEIYELRKVRRDLPFPLNLRNCALGRVVEYLKARNATTTSIEVNILSGLRIGEVPAIGGKCFSALFRTLTEGLFV